MAKSKMESSMAKNGFFTYYSNKFLSGYSVRSSLQRSGMSVEHLYI